MFAKIIVDIASSNVDKIFDYKLNENLPVGTRVMVPFGNRKMEGYIIALSETTENILSKFQLLNQGKPNNAAVALFAKESGLYTQLELRMARFKGNGKNEFGDNQRVTGNFFKLFDAGMSFFFKHLNLSGKIVGTKREEELYQ